MTHTFTLVVLSFYLHPRVFVVVVLTHTHTHTRTHARTHAHTHTRTRLTALFYFENGVKFVISILETSNTFLYLTAIQMKFTNAEKTKA